MKKELATSFNVVLPRDFSKEIIGLRKKLSSKFEEKRFYDSSPHLAIATKFMTKEESEKFVSAIKDEFKNEVAWEIEFSDFSLSDDNKYIFLNLSEESGRKMFNIHNRAINSTKEVGAEGMSGNPPRYLYFPHVSIIKLDESDTKKAIKLTQNNFKGRKIRITEYEITRQEEDEKGFAHFPVFATVKLNQ